MTGKASGCRQFHILLVEDETTVRAILAEALAGAGFRVTQAESGDTAWRFFGGQGRFDLLLTDVHMPGTLSGVDLARHVRSRWPLVPVVFVTGRPDALPQSGALGPRDRLVVKPCRSSALLHAVHGCLAA